MTRHLFIDVVVEGIGCHEGKGADKARAEDEHWEGEFFCSMAFDRKLIVPANFSWQLAGTS